MPSEATLDAVTRRFPGAPVVLIPQGIDDAFFAPDTQRRPPSAPPMILYTGGYGYRKRVGDLLRAFELVRARFPEASLVLTGRAPEGLATSIARVAGSNRIETTGIVSDTDLARLYRRAAVVAYPSVLEGFGFPVLEAFASGTPVVATRSGSIPEIAGDAACLVSPQSPGDLADGLLEVITNEGLASRLSARGHERAQGFRWSRTAMLTADVYRTVA